jgi:hypothetical protein
VVVDGIQKIGPGLVVKPVALADTAGTTLSSDRAAGTSVAPEGSNR